MEVLVYLIMKLKKGKMKSQRLKKIDRAQRLAVPHIAAALFALPGCDLILFVINYRVQCNKGELIMIKKLTHVVFALFIGLLICSIEGQFKCVTPGAFPLGGGIIQPLVSSPQFDPNESEARQQLIIDERIHGPSSAPGGGIGLMQKWEF